MRFTFLRKPFFWIIFLLVMSAMFCAYAACVYQVFRSRIVDRAHVQHAPVAVVFGAGITKDGSPSDVLQDRLDVAAQLFTEGIVDRILVSGDNSTTDYDEPSNMMRYLVEKKNISENSIYRDFAGRRTYDTCVRAKEIWGIDHAILVTQSYHLPRALMLCDAVGIDVSGVSATLQKYVRMPQYAVREVLAFVQGIIDAYVLPPSYVGGELETDLDP